VTRGICTTNNRFNQSRIFDSKTKIKFHSRTGNTGFTPGIEVWSADGNILIFLIRMDMKENKFWFRIWFSASSPAKHVLLVHINLSHGLNFHQRLKIRLYMHTNSSIFKLWTLNHYSFVGEPRKLSWHRRTPQKREIYGLNLELYRNLTCIFDIDSFWKLPQISKCKRDQSVKIDLTYAVWLRLFPCIALWFEHGTLVPQSYRSIH